MFEFVGKSPRRVKFVNVTEARATFATILSDLESHYVITKNNKPRRVIVNFEDFEQWLNFLQSKAAVISEPKAVVPVTDLGCEPSVQDEPTETTEKQDNVSQTAVETDYFNSTTSEDLSAEVERLLPEPVDDVPPDSCTLDKEAATDPRPATPPMTTPVPTAEAEARVAEGSEKDFLGHVAKTPEEEEYYRRYRKLYESFYTPNPAVLPSASGEGPPPPTAEENSVQTKIEAHFSHDDNDKYLNQTEKSREDQNTDGEVAGDSATNKNVHNSAQENNPMTLDEVKSTSEKLPSLQELLKDLEQQHLSAEDGEPLKTEDIDELINRIASD